MNIVVLTGRLVRNAIVHGKERQALKFTLACDSGYNAQSQKPHTDFVPCTVFGAPDKLRDLLANEGKGKAVEIQGRITTGSFEHNGTPRYVTEVIGEARNLHLARNGSPAAPTASQKPASSTAQQAFPSSAYRTPPTPSEDPLPPY